MVSWYNLSTVGVMVKTTRSIGWHQKAGLDSYLDSGPSGVVADMLKAAGDDGTRWMTELIMQRCG